MTIEYVPVTAHTGLVVIPVAGRLVATDTVVRGADRESLKKAAASLQELAARDFGRPHSRRRVDPVAVSDAVRWLTDGGPSLSSLNCHDQIRIVTDAVHDTCDPTLNWQPTGPISGLLTIGRRGYLVVGRATAGLLLPGQSVVGDDRAVRIAENVMALRDRALAGYARNSVDRAV